jgi:HEPN domain-containing protein
MLSMNETGKLWYRASKEHLQHAKNAFNINDFYLAYTEAMYSGECSLKSILACFNRLTDDDLHHKFKKLLNRIEDENIISSTLLDSIEAIIGNPSSAGLGRIDLNSPSGSYQDCFSEQLPSLRYPKDNSSPDEFIEEADARSKIEEAENLINLISTLF